MKLIPLNCRQCGAPLKVPEDVKHVTCLHCGTQLAVVHEGGAAYTEKIAELDQRTSEIEQRVDQLYLNQQLAELDQAWEKEQAYFYIRDKQGGERLPSVEGTLVAAIASVLGPILFVLFPLFGKAPEGMVVVAVWGGILFAVVGLGSSMNMYRRAIAYQAAERRYRRRRKELQGAR